MKTTELKQGFKAGRESGQLEKVRDDEEGKGRFRLTGNQPGLRFFRHPYG